MNLAKWKSLSDKFGHGRTDELKEVDRAVSLFHATPTLVNLKALAWRVMDWQASKANWLRVESIRAAPMKELVNLIKESSRQVWPEVGGWIFNRLHCEKALVDLINNPMVWLAARRLNIGGKGDGQRHHYLRVEHIDPTFSQDDLIHDSFMATTPIVYRIDDGTPEGAKIDDAMCIKMHTDITDTSAAAAVINHLVPLAGNFMVTGMMNGCTFLIEDAGGANNLTCTHIKPVGQDAMDLNDQINGFNLNHTLTYGQRDYGASMAVTIIGLTKGSWQIYAQLGSRSDRGNVTRVLQLYP